MTPTVTAPATAPVSLLGTTNAGPLAGVDGRGGLRGLDGSWSIDWWVGADDRWHVPADEPAVRQRLVESTPVVETAMRVPTGDAVATTFGARVGGLPDDLLALDIVNDTTLPFALALVLTGKEGVVVDGTRAVIDGTTEVRFGRAPSRLAAGPDLDAVRATVMAGDAADAAAATDATGRTVAVLFPLAHTARLRTTITVAAGRADPEAAGATTVAQPVVVPIADAPEAEQVARGWRSQLDRGLAVRLPDERLTDAIALARAQVLLAAAGPVADASVADLAGLIEALVRQGFGEESRVPVALLAARQRLNGRFGRGDDAGPATVAALRAFGDQWHRTHDRRLADALVGPVAKAAHRIGKGRGPAPDGTAAALAASVSLLAGAGQLETAQSVADLPAARTAAAGARPAAPVVPLDQVSDVDGASGEQDPRFAVLATRLLRLVGDGLVADGPEASLQLFAGFPSSWFGQAVEVHDAPTPYGLLSCAIRWHGERPALLWDRRPWDDAPPDEVVTLTAPALDPTWSSSEPKGEALLAAPAAPDLGASFS